MLNRWERKAVKYWEHTREDPSLKISSTKSVHPLFCAVELCVTLEVKIISLAVVSPMYIYDLLKPPVVVRNETENTDVFT